MADPAIVRPNMINIFVVSDGTGGTADQAVRAALTQFAEAEVEIRIRGEVRSEKRVREVIEEAAAESGFVVHTLASTALRNAIAEFGRLFNVVTIDLFGPLLAELAHQFADTPSERPGMFRELNREYFRRIEAMEFALRHDDGQRSHELTRAEIILIGVSRTFKTPLSVYLAFRGWMVANVPIILDIPPPKILTELPPERIVALATDAYHLSHLRRARQDYFRGATGDYASFDHVRRELSYATRLFSAHPEWLIIEVTNKPIEEIASEILRRKRRTVLN